MKRAVLFPGIGYTCEKPLLYYAGRMAREMGYEVIPVPYGHFPENVKGDAGKMALCFRLAWEQAEAMLEERDWSDCGDILFIGKSIGTVVAARYAETHGLSARLILLTPLREPFRFARANAIAFHGTADPWADTSDIREACAARGIPLRITEGANHSLETGGVDADLNTLIQTMDAIRAFIKGTGR